MTNTTLKGYRKPLLELIETETADICAASVQVIPDTDPFELETW